MRRTASGLWLEPKHVPLAHPMRADQSVVVRRTTRRSALITWTGMGGKRSHRGKRRMKNTKFEIMGGPRLRDRPPTRNRCFLTTGWRAKSRFAPAAAACGLHSLSVLPSRRRDVALDAAELRSKTVRTAPPDANRPAPGESARLKTRLDSSAMACRDLERAGSSARGMTSGRRSGNGGEQPMARDGPLRGGAGAWSRAGARLGHRPVPVSRSSVMAPTR